MGVFFVLPTLVHSVLHAVAARIRRETKERLYGLGGRPTGTEFLRPFTTQMMDFTNKTDDFANILNGNFTNKHGEFTIFYQQTW